MKLKKVLAVALAATTALTSGTAYSLLAPTDSVEAAGTRATTTTTFSTKEISDGCKKIGGTGVKVVYTYEVNKVRSDILDENTIADVTLIDVDVASGELGTNEYLEEIKVPDHVDANDITSDLLNKMGVAIDGFDVNKVRLDASKMDDGDKIKLIDLGDVKDRLREVTLENFTNDEFAFETTTTGGFTGLETVDFSGSAVEFNSSINLR